MRRSSIPRYAGRRCTLHLLVLFLVASGTAHAAAQTEIVINIPAFKLYLYQNGVPVKTYPIGVGQVVKPSQLGETKIINRVFHPTYYPPDWYAKGLQPIPPGPDNPVGTRWLGLGFQGYGIHGTNDPSSIGTAASSGCIRMYNHDVEELADLVRVGTVVRFVYDTIQAWRDPVSGNELILVHKDLYRQGTNTLDAALKELEEIGGARGVDRWTLGAILDEAAAEARPVPRSVPLTLNGERLSINAVHYGGQLLLPLEPLAEILNMTVTRSSREVAGAFAVGGMIVPGSFAIGSRAFAPVEAAAEGFGLVVQRAGSEGVALRSVELVDRGRRPMAVRTHVLRDWLLLPVQELAAQLGVDVRWEKEREAVVIDGKPVFGAFIIENRAYLPHDRIAELLGVRITWSPELALAMLETAEVRMTESGRTTMSGQGFVYGADVYVPLRMITDQLRYTLGWNQATQTAFVQGMPIRGVVRDGRIYASVRALRDVVPSLDYRWNEEEFDLTLVIGGR